MTQQRAGGAVDRLVRAVLRSGTAGVPDGDLLGAFVDRRDGAAFEALVRLHGPMVMAVCRRVLGDHHDAEDAFQATFLVLARRAAAVRPPGMLAGWLFGVARQTARKARSVRLRRLGRERPAAELPEPAAPEAAAPPELWPVLDRELARLPEKYRAVVVLCDLEGRTRREAARCLGWPEGSVSSRLARARDILAGRLARHGLAAPAGALAAVFADRASAAVQARLVVPTAEAAVAVAAGRVVVAGAAPAAVVSLTRGVLNAMLVSKIKTVLVAAVATAALVLGGSQLAHQPARAADPPPGATGVAADDPAPRRSPADELALARARELLLREELKRKDRKILDLTGKLEVADVEGIIYRDQLKRKDREIENLKLAAGARELLLKEWVREREKEIERLRQEVETLKGKK